MKPKSLLGPLLLLLAVASGAAAGEGVADPKEIKRLLIDVERIRRLEPKEQTKEVERLYRTLAPRIRELNRYHLRPRELDYTKGRDQLTPEAWVEKACDTVFVIHARPLTDREQRRYRRRTKG